MDSSNTANLVLLSHALQIKAAERGKNELKKRRKHEEKALKKVNDINRFTLGNTQIELGPFQAIISDSPDKHSESDNSFFPWLEAGT